MFTQQTVTLKIMGGDATAGLNAAKRCVLGLRLRFSAEKGEYTQEPDLGGV